MKPTQDDYNGYSNYETWNVALWICNDEGLYREAKRYRRRGYRQFVDAMSEMGKENHSMTGNSNQISTIYFQTPDGVSWNDPRLDIDQLDDVLSDL